MCTVPSFHSFLTFITGKAMRLELALFSLFFFKLFFSRILLTSAFDKLMSSLCFVIMFHRKKTNLKCRIQILMLISTHLCQLITALYSLVHSRQIGNFTIYQAGTLMHWFQVYVHATYQPSINVLFRPWYIIYVAAFCYQRILLISFFQDTDVQKPLHSHLSVSFF